MSDDDKKDGKTRGRPWPKGVSGNPAGRPKGARHHVTRAIDQFLEGEAEDVTRACVLAAKAGDPTAMRLCMERLNPVRKGKPIEFEMPKVEGLEDIAVAFAAIMRGIAEGEITPDEGSMLAGILEGRRRTIESVDLERRIAEIEQRDKGNG